MDMRWNMLLTGINRRGRKVRSYFYNNQHTSFLKGIFGQQDVDYKDWLECTVKHPLAMN